MLVFFQGEDDRQLVSTHRSSLRTCPAPEPCPALNWVFPCPASYTGSRKRGMYYTNKKTGAMARALIRVFLSRLFEFRFNLFEHFDKDGIKVGSGAVNDNFARFFMAERRFIGTDGNERVVHIANCH